MPVVATPDPKRSAAPPLYLQLAMALRDGIVSGAFPVGTLLPTEDDLREQYKVSRFTVREAIRKLREDGLVTSRQGAGTVVLPAPAESDRVLNTISIDDLVALGTDTRMEVADIGLKRITGRQASRFGVPPGDEWLAMSGLRRVVDDAAPICWVEYIIAREFAAIGRQLPGLSSPVFRMIEDRFAVSVAAVRQDIGAMVLDDDMAARLHTTSGSAALEIRREYRIDETRIAQVTINTHPAATYRHSMTMRRLTR